MTMGTNRVRLSVSLFLLAVLTTECRAAEPLKDAWGDPLPEGAVARARRKRDGFDVPVLSLAFSPDGKTLAIGTAGNGLYLWDVATRKELHRLVGDSRGVPAVRFSPDG